MELTLDYFSCIFNQFLEKDKRYQEALGIVRANSKGGVWLIGGYVFRNLIRELYGRGKPSKDLDFLVEEPVKRFNLPRGWKIEESRFGSPKFIKGDEQIDFIPLGNVVHINFYGLERTIANFLERVPFNIHSIAYDVQRKRVIGRIGKEALKQKIVRVNDLKMAELYAKRYKTTIESLLRKKAKELGFEAECDC